MTHRKTHNCCFHQLLLHHRTIKTFCLVQFPLLKNNFNMYFFDSIEEKIPLNPIYTDARKDNLIQGIPVKKVIKQLL